MGNDLSKLDTAAKWVDDKWTPHIVCNEGETCGRLCGGYFQMGIPSEGKWWGTQPFFPTNDCKGVEFAGRYGRGYSCRRITCDAATFGDPFPNRKDVQKSCRCLHVDAKHEGEHHQEIWGQACMAVYEDEVQGTNHFKEVHEVCAAVVDYFMFEERYMLAIEDQFMKQGVGVKECCRAELKGAIVRRHLLSFTFLWIFLIFLFFLSVTGRSF